MWQQLAYFAITLALSIALAPRPKPPRAAAIDDFDFPTAEEGRPIPVVFGTVEITGPNVLWYGDLRIRPIRKRSGFSRTTVGYRYYIGFHLGLCHGPVDAVTRLTWDDKEAWTGSITVSATGSISAPSLFGGEGRGGGVVGDFDITMGGGAQTPNSYLVTAIGAAQPAYKGVTCLVWKGDYIGDSEFVKPVGVTLTRIFAGWEGATWYAGKAATGGGMNPAHIIYQCLTDSNWGMGVATNRISDAAFEAAADQLDDDGFGLNLIWNQSSSIEQFIQIILDHIGGGLTLRLDNGLYELTLFRADYVKASLPLYNASKVIDLTSYQKQGWGTTANEVTLIYTDPATLKATSLTAQDLGNVDSQGSRIPAVVELLGIRSHAVAKEVLGRELAARTTPLAKVTLQVNRAAWNLGFGSLFRLDWDEPAIDDKVFRVLTMDRGDLRDGAITIEAIEDIYQYPIGAGLVEQGNGAAPVVPGTPPDDPGGESVISATTVDPPVTPTDGDTYFVPEGATGDWAGQDGKLAEWDDELGDWLFYNIPDGSIGFVQDSGVTVQVVSGVATPLFGTGSTQVVAGGFAVDKSYMWTHRTAVATEFTGETGRRIRGFGRCIDFRFRVGDSFPSAAFGRNTNTGEVTYSQNLGCILDHYHDAPSRYYYVAGTTGIFPAGPPSIRRVDLMAENFVAVATWADALYGDYVLSITLLGAHIYACVYSAPTITNVVKLDAETLAYVDDWNYTSDAPQFLRTDGTNLWYTSGAECGRINITTGAKEATFTPTYGPQDSVVVYNPDLSHWELWSFCAGFSPDPARLVRYRLTPGGGGHGANIGELLLASGPTATYLSRTNIIVDGDLLTFGRDDPETIVAVAIADVPNVHNFLDILDRSFFNAKRVGFYRPAFLPQPDVLPVAVSPPPSRTWITVLNEDTKRNERVPLASTVAAGNTRGATWVGDAAITPPINTVSIYFDGAATIRAVSILTHGGTGSCLIGIWKRPIGSYPPGGGDTIVASAPPEIVADSTYFDDVLTGWTTAIDAGDVITFSLTTSSTFEFIHVALHLE